MKQAVEMLHEFHKAYGVDKTDRETPGNVTNKILRLRCDLIVEEFNEYCIACAGNDIVAIADALADLTYVVIGTALAHGIHNFDDVFTEVHRSNMSKIGRDGKPIYRDDGKVLKGPNYIPPNIAALVGEN